MYFRSNTIIQESIYSHDNNMGYVGPSLRRWRDSCVPGLGSWTKFFFLLLPHLLHHFSNGPSLRHIACDIKHCEINNGQSVDMNIVFASHRSRFKNRTKQVRFYLLFNFHSQFTNKSVGSYGCNEVWNRPEVQNGLPRRNNWRWRGDMIVGKRPSWRIFSWVIDVYYLFL